VPDMKKEQFVGERLKPDAATFNTFALVGGVPQMPKRFTWRGETFEVAEVLDGWKELGPAKEGGARQYLRKHWFHIRTTTGEEMKIYFERTARSTKMRKTRWWLYSLVPTRKGRKGTSQSTPKRTEGGTEQ